MAASALQYWGTTNSLPQPYEQSIIGSQGGERSGFCLGGNWRASKERRHFCSVFEEEEALGNVEQMARHAADKQSTNRSSHFAFIEIRYLNGRHTARTSGVHAAGCPTATDFLEHRNGSWDVRERKCSQLEEASQLLAKRLQRSVV